MNRHFLTTVAVTSGLLLADLALPDVASAQSSKSTKSSKYRPRRRGSAARRIGTGAVGGAAVGGLLGRGRGAAIGAAAGAGAGAAYNRGRRRSGR